MHQAAKQQFTPSPYRPTHRPPSQLYTNRRQTAP